MSNALLTCAELTPLDLVALCNGLELLPEENERLLRCLADMYRGKLNVHDYEKLFISPECPFGNGNFLFPPI